MQPDSVNLEVKNCTKCNIIKPISDFRFIKSTNKPCSHCKICVCSAQKVYQKNNRAKINTYKRQFYKKNTSNKQYIIDNKDKIISKIKNNITIDNNNCWNWIRSVDSNNYATINIKGITQRCSRISYQIFNNKTIDNLCVLHKCDNPKCVNPDHLFLGTRQDNSKDMVAKNRQPSGERHIMSKLKENDIKIIRELAKSTPTIIISKIFNICPSHIIKIINKKAWKYI